MNVRYIEVVRQGVRKKIHIGSRYCGCSKSLENAEGYDFPIPSLRTDVVTDAAAQPTTLSVKVVCNYCAYVQFEASGEELFKGRPPLPISVVS